jgi:hypothetical protein
MPNLARWQRIWSQTRGTVDASVFAADVQARYDDLYARRPRFLQRALQAHLDDNILPGLAVYQVLREMGLSQDEALDHVEPLLAATVQPARHWLARLGRRPFFFPAFRRLIWLEMRLGFPPEGWQTTWIENSAEPRAKDAPSRIAAHSPRLGDVGVRQPLTDRLPWAHKRVYVSFVLSVTLYYHVKKEQNI